MPDEQQVAYGHPWVVAFTLLFKVRPAVPVKDTCLSEALSSAWYKIWQQQRWLVSVQVASVVVYMVCGLFSSSFITNFVVVTILLMLDFWTVRLPTPELLRTLGCHNQALPSCCSCVDCDYKK